MTCVFVHPKGTFDHINLIRLLERIDLPVECGRISARMDLSPEHSTINSITYQRAVFSMFDGRPIYAAPGYVIREALMKWQGTTAYGAKRMEEAGRQEMAALVRGGQVMDEELKEIGPAQPEQQLLPTMQLRQVVAFGR